VKAKRELKRREESGYPRSNLIKGSEALLSEQQNISSAQIEGISLFNEDANSNDNFEDDSMPDVSIGNMAANNQFQGFLVEQIFKHRTSNANPKGRNNYIIGIIEEPDDF
jgi:hypothetical protein